MPDQIVRFLLYKGHIMNDQKQTTDKYYIASWEDPQVPAFIIAPILFRREECERVKSLLIHAGLREVEMIEAQQ